MKPITEVASRLGVCRATIYRLVEEKKLRSTRVLSSIRILEDDVAAMLAFAEERSDPGVPFAATGYCMGGNTALLSVTRLGADAAASYYGTLMHDYLDEFKDASAPVLLHMPEHDWTYTEAQRDQIIAEAKKNPAITVHIYPEPHGFATGRRKPNGAGDLSDARTFELFERFK